VSPIRVNIDFIREKALTIESYVTGQSYSQFVITTRLYHGAVPNKSNKTTILHYMLAKFGFVDTLKRFGLSPDDVLFTTMVSEDKDQFEYFSAMGRTKTQAVPTLFLKVRKTLLLDSQTTRFVVNLLYILAPWDYQTIDNVYVGAGFHEHLSAWKVILGWCIMAERMPPRAVNNADSNLRSVDFFIDPLTRERFNRFGVVISDIYDLLVYVFKHIDEIIMDNIRQDLYNARLDVANGILVQSFARPINDAIYRLIKKSNIGREEVANALKFPVTLFRQKNRHRSEDAKEYTAPPDIVGDNFLFAGGLVKIRMGGKADQRFHPSQMVAESVSAFVGQNIGRTGYINPFVPTDRSDPHNAILHPDYADEIDELIPYLPR
jgi:hypothetical protein